MSPWIPRLALIALAIGVGYAIVSVSIGEEGPQPIEIEGIQEVQNAVVGIRQDGARLGAENAPVTIDLFTDLRATNAADYQWEVVNPVIDEYVRSERAQINLRHFSFGRSPVTEPALAAYAAGEQGHQWQYAELVMKNLDNAGPSGLDEQFLNEIAEVTPGLAKGEWESAFAEELRRQSENPDYESQVDRDGELAFELKLPAQPALIVTGPGGSERLVDAPGLDEVRAAIDRVEVVPD